MTPLMLLSAALISACTGNLKKQGTDSDRIAPVSITAVGDVMVHETQLRTAWEESCRCWNYHKSFEEVRDYIGKSDFNIANLETTLPGDPKRFSGYPEFGAPDSLATALKDTGFNLITTANNHSLDKGASGLVRTIEVVRSSGMHSTGTWPDPDSYARERVTVIKRKGHRIVFLNYTYGTNGIRIPAGKIVNLIDKKNISYDIAAAREQNADAIIVLYHYGAEYIRFPDSFQKEMTDFAFSEGADIVIGGHPHVLQPFEVKEVTDRYGIRKPRLAAYSLGNFISSQVKRYTDGGKIFNFKFIKNPKGPGLLFGDIDYIPVWVYSQYGGPRPGHFIIPVEKHLNNPESPVKGSYRTKMELFYRDITEHLAPSRQAASEINRKNAEFFR